jgi:2-keto-4-pentenoate hydratase
MSLDTQKLVDLLVDARRSGQPVHLPPSLRPAGVAEGYAVAAQLVARLGPAAGWKVGATNARGQQALGIAEPICGRVWRAGLASSGATLSFPGGGVEAEPEIIFEMAAPASNVRASVARVFVGLELVRSAFADPFALGAAAIVADNAAHLGLVVGPEIPLAALDQPGGVAVSLRRNGVAVAEGNSAAVLGHPLHVLEWLMAKARQLGQPLAAGDLVATGALCRPAPFAAGDRIEADFGAVGVVCATAG